MGTFFQEGAPDNVATDVFYSNNSDGSFGIPIQIEVPTGFYSKMISLAVDKDGNAHIAFIRADWQTAGSGDLYYVNNVGGSFDEPILLLELVEYQGLSYPSLAVDDDGNVHIAFYAGYPHDAIYYMNNTEGDFGTPEKVSKDIVVLGVSPVICIDSAGNVHLTFVGLNSHNEQDRDVYYTNNVGGEFGDPINVSDDPELSQGWWWTSLAVDSAGYAHIAYDDFEKTITYVNNTSGRFENHVIISYTGGFRPTIGVDSLGRVHIAYKEPGPPGYENMDYSWNPSGHWVEMNILPRAMPVYYMYTGERWFVLDKSDVTHFVYYSDSPEGAVGEIFYLRVDCSWVTVPDVTFTDVATEVGVGNIDAEASVSFGDYNNDGYPDIYVANHGPNRLYRNNRDGTFTDVAVEAGVEGPTGSFD
jgi:hypothetical protein